MALLPGFEDNFISNNDWETPPNLAKFVASLVSGKNIIDAGAGNGAITRFLPGNPYAIELNRARYKNGSVNASNAKWINKDYLRIKPKFRVDCIVSNPPFNEQDGLELGLEFIKKSLEIIDKDGLIILILPSTFFQTKKAKNFILANNLVFSFSDIFMISGRVGYIKNEVVHNGRQCYDSVFTLVPHIGSTNVEIIEL